MEAKPAAPFCWGLEIKTKYQFPGDLEMLTQLAEFNQGDTRSQFLCFNSACNSSSLSQSDN